MRSVGLGPGPNFDVQGAANVACPPAVVTCNAMHAHALPGISDAY